MEDISNRNRDNNFVANFGGRNEEEVHRLDSERSAGNFEMANRGSGNKIQIHEPYQSLYDTKK